MGRDDRPDIREQRRFDVVTRVTDVDLRTGRVRWRIDPDPRRYEWQERKGERMLYDRFDRTLMPRHVVMDAFKQLAKMTRPPPLPVLADIGRYIGDRRPVIRSALDGGEVTSDRADASEELLASLAGDELGFVILSVDVVDSSTLANTVETVTLARLLSTLLTEVAELVALFYGHVLRYAGDGLVAYFPEPGFITKNDLAVDCAVCVRRLVYEGVNAELGALGMPSMEVRLGLDAGEAAVRVLGSPHTKRHADIIGDVVSLACNIESTAEPGRILVGGTVERNLHVSWREQCEGVDIPAGWSLRGADGEPYQLFRVRTGAVRPIERARRRL